MHVIGRPCAPEYAGSRAVKYIHAHWPTRPHVMARQAQDRSQREALPGAVVRYRPLPTVGSQIDWPPRSEGGHVMGDAYYYDDHVAKLQVLLEEVTRFQRNGSR